MRGNNRKPNRRTWKKQYIINKNESNSSDEDNYIEEDNSTKEFNIFFDDNEIERCHLTKKQFDKDRVLDQSSLASGHAIYNYVENWDNYNKGGIIKFICNYSGILNFCELNFHFLDAENTKLGQNLANILTDDLKKNYKLSSMDYSYFGVNFKHIKIRPTSFTIGADNLNSFAIFGWNDLKSDWTLILRLLNFDDDSIQTFPIDSSENYSIFVLMQIDQGNDLPWGFSIAHFDIDGDITTIETESSENDDKNYLCDLNRLGIERLNDVIF